MMNEDLLKELLEKYVTETITPEEKKQLAGLMDLPESRQRLQSLMEETFMSDSFEGQGDEQIRLSIQRFLDKHIYEEATPVAVSDGFQRRSPVFRIGRWVAAAVLLAVFAGVAYFLLPRQNEGEKVLSQEERLTNDVAPGGDNAILILADGTQINLDSAAGAGIPQQGGAKVIRLDGLLSYNQAADRTETSQVVYNTIATPRGGQYRVVLPDGSKVWLNAASSLRFPTAFAGAERSVEMSGEVYFEVAHNAAKPFYVHVNGMDVQVLGTHFNINSYEDESTVNTTLLEGGVRVAKASSFVLLKPGQQSRLDKSGSITVRDDVDVEEVMAWKNGNFRFGEAMDIKMIMRQLVRWYDIEVEYKGLVTGRIGGTISRDVNISKVLEMLEMTGAVRFNVQGRKVVVMPK